MARLLTCGFETRLIATTAATTADGDVAYYVGTPTINTAIPRSGGACLEVATGAARKLRADLTGVLDRTYYARVAVRRSGTVTGTTGIFTALATNTVAFTIGLNTSNQIVLIDANSVQQGSTFATSVDTWYVAEVKFVIPTAGNGTCSLRVDGTAVSTDVSMDVNNAVFNNIHFGSMVTNVGTTLYFDDCALNDDQGTAQNTWCYSGHVVLLKPTALGAGGRGNWTSGGGGTSNLVPDVSTVPPAGTAAGSDGTQIENGTSGTSSCEFDCQTYTAGGVGGGDTVKLLQGLWRVGTSSTTSGNTGTARVFGNPDVGGDDSIDFEGSGATAGTDPAGWRTYKGAIAYLPTVTKGSAPQIRITKTVSTTRVHSCDLMGVLVEYGTADPQTVTGAATMSGAGDLTASGKQSAEGVATASGTGGLTGSGKQSSKGVAALSGAGGLTGDGSAVYDKVTFVNAGPAMFSATTGDTITSAAISVTAGDLVVCCCNMVDHAITPTAAWSTSGSFTRKLSYTAGARSAIHVFGFYATGAISSETITITATGNLNSIQGVAGVFRGTDTSLGVALPKFASTFAQTANLKVPIDVDQRGTLVVAAAGWDNNPTSNLTIPAGETTMRHNNFTGTGTNYERQAWWRKNTHADTPSTVTIGADGDLDFAPNWTIVAIAIAPPTTAGQVTGAATMSGAGDLSASGKQSAEGVATAAGAGDLTATGKATVKGVATATGAGALTATGTRIAVGVVTATGTGDLTATGKATVYAVATGAGVGDLTADGNVAVPTVYGAAELAGAGDLTADGTVTVWERPDGTITTNGWTAVGAASLWQAIDETTASDADYIQSALSPVSADICEVQLSNLGDPLTGKGHLVSYRFQKSAAGGDTINLTVRLVQGTTVIASWTESNIGAVTTVTRELSTAEADAITDYNDLRLRFEAVAV